MNLGMRSVCCTMAQRDLIRNNFETIRSNLYKHDGGQVILEKDDDTGIAQIILDRPEKHNALSGRMMVEFRDCVQSLEEWDAGKGVMLRGVGTSFCSGGDLGFARMSTPQDGMDMSLWMINALLRLQKLPLVSCCLVQGAAIGGGSELSIFCDYIVATDDVKFGFVEGKMGVTTAWGGGTRLAQKVGHKTALDMLLTCQILNAQEGVEMGLFDAVVSSNKAMDWFSTKLQLEREVIRAYKQIISNSLFCSYENALVAKTDIFAPFWGGPINKKMLSKNIKHL